MSICAPVSSSITKIGPKFALAGGILGIPGRDSHDLRAIATLPPLARELPTFFVANGALLFLPLPP